MNGVLARIRDERVMAIIRAASSDELMETAQALREGGIRCMEFTMTTPGALDCLHKVTRALGDDMLLGAGTVLDPETARAVLLAGAKFIVTPALNREVVTMAKRYGAPVTPGALTPTEILAAWEAGADMVKVFPAARMGPEYLKDIHGPFPQIPLLPTGGISPDNAVDYLKAGAVAVGIGGNLTRRGPNDTPADLTDRARRLLESVRNV
jgi:2-dehydro-3-deoxyphosphogluconate aldolase / (4S)-4-hydroxy-2-oxoglutarate aldolase